MGLSSLIVIPARFDSSRFPGKPLAELNGKPIIQHVWESAMSATRPGKIVVATDDERIVACVRGFGGTVQLTASSHRNGTERVAEVASDTDAEIVVNLQGDLPLFEPKVLDQLLEASMKWILSNKAEVVTLRSEIQLKTELFSPNTVKVVSDREDRALYFSRAPIPHIAPEDYQKRDREIRFFKHFGIYCFAKSFLLDIVARPTGQLESAEGLEQLRILEQGARIALLTLDPVAARAFVEINTPEDLENAKALLASSEL
ncbi:MAG: 3-deoxy-manno-octulosonate cytidylyltransferase [Nitrospiria bacterium]